MGLSRDIREINRQMLTDKQEKQLARQERQQLKDLQLLEAAQKQHLQLYLRNKIQYYLDLNFAKYKNDLYLISLKNEIQQNFINKNKEYIDIVFIYFDEFYYKELKQQIKIYEMNNKAIDLNTPVIVEPPTISKKEGLFIARTLTKTLLQIIINTFAAIFGICAILSHPVNSNKKRRF